MTQTITPYVLYEDVATAMDFLSSAFGFEEVLRYTGAEGYVNHAEMRIGDGTIYLGDPGDHYRNPRKVGHETVGLYVTVDNVDATFEQATAAGAEIKDPVADQPYGDRRFIALDPEGHYWFFSQPTREVAPEEWGAVSASTS